ncbi:hypothetical protein [Streptomyces sp. TR02-1]|uniref:hypothetical protein n=1 Tax=Streptomyces sp. TR02-1 TaxID=3385977 RepID=UPI00399F7AFD
MDEGVAGLLGASIGAFFGAGGAIGAAFLARGAMLRQTERQVDAAHAQWRRTMRRDTCVAFIRAAQDFSLAAEKAARKGTQIIHADDVLTQDREEFENLCSLMDTAHKEMSTAGITMDLESAGDLTFRSFLDLRVDAFLVSSSLARETSSASEAYRKAMLLEAKVADFARDARHYLNT